MGVREGEPKGSTRRKRGGTMRARGNWMFVSRGRLIALLLVIAAVGAASCASSGSKEGGAREPVVLKLADGYQATAFEPAVAYFMKRVEQLSAGKLRIQDVQGWGDLQPDLEQRIVSDVAAGKADLGWTGTRIFDTLGVTSFQALTAPMLIDSYALEHAVVTSSIPSEMLKGLDALHLTGLAVLGDGLRKPIAQDGPLLAPSDWEGVLFNVFRSKGQTAAIAAMGAQPTDVFVGDVAYTAAEKNLLIYERNYVARFPYVTSNVNLWPQTLALFANPASLARLTGEERGWVRRAAADAAAGSTGFFDHDQDLVEAACAKGARYAEASERDLTSMRQAFDGVYAGMEQDPQTKGFIEQIKAQKDALPAAPALRIPDDCLSSKPPAEDPLQGRWQSDRLTRSQIARAFVAAGGSEVDGRAFFGARQYEVIVLDFEHGSLIQLQSNDGGPLVEGDQNAYTLDGNTITLSAAGCESKLTVELKGDTLRLRGLFAACAVTAEGTTIYASFPFSRVP
jgi:TRAP-type transport system periplasmic protein